MCCCFVVYISWANYEAHWCRTVVTMCLSDDILSIGSGLSCTRKSLDFTYTYRQAEKKATKEKWFQLVGEKAFRVTQFCMGKKLWVVKQWSSTDFVDTRIDFCVIKCEWKWGGSRASPIFFLFCFVVCGLYVLSKNMIAWPLLEVNAYPTTTTVDIRVFSQPSFWVGSYDCLRVILSATFPKISWISGETSNFVLLQKLHDLPLISTNKNIGPFWWACRWSYLICKSGTYINPLLIVWSVDKMWFPSP